MTTKSPHISVMLSEFLHFFQDKALKVFFEGTVGAAGHAKALLQAHPEIDKYIGCDQDPMALKIAQDNLTPWKSKVRLEQGNFSHLDEYLKRHKCRQVDGFFLTWGYRLCS